MSQIYFSAVEAYSKGWQALKKNMGKHILVFLGILIVVFLISYFTNPQMKTLMSGDMHAMLQSGEPVMPQFSFGKMFLSYLLQVLVTVFLYGYTLEAVKNPEVPINEVISRHVTGKKILHYILLSILLLILIWGLMLFSVPLALALGKYAGLVILILVFVLIYIVLRLMFSAYFIFDENVGVLDALQKSWQATAGHIGQLILFILIAIGISFLSLLTLGIAFIITVPWMYFAQAVAYYMLAGKWRKSTGAAEEILPES